MIVRKKQNLQLETLESRLVLSGDFIGALGPQVSLVTTIATPRQVASEALNAESAKGLRVGERTYFDVRVSSALIDEFFHDTSFEVWSTNGTPESVRKEARLGQLAASDRAASLFAATSFYEVDGDLLVAHTRLEPPELGVDPYSLWSIVDGNLQRYASGSGGFDAIGRANNQIYFQSGSCVLITCSWEMHRTSPGQGVTKVREWVTDFGETVRETVFEPVPELEPVKSIGTPVSWNDEFAWGILRQDTLGAISSIAGVSPGVVFQSNTVRPNGEASDIQLYDGEQVTSLVEGALLSTTHGTQILLIDANGTIIEDQEIVDGAFGLVYRIADGNGSFLNVFNPALESVGTRRIPDQGAALELFGSVGQFDLHIATLDGDRPCRKLFDLSDRTAVSLTANCIHDFAVRDDSIWSWAPDEEVQVLDANTGEARTLQKASSNVVFLSEDAYFVDAAVGKLWQSDGTVEGTVSVTSLEGIQSRIFASDDWVIFMDNDNDLWRTDGTEAGTMQLVSFSDEGGDKIGGFVESNGLVVFSVGQELWSTDGTVDGTQLAVKVDPDAQASSVDKLFAQDEKQLFALGDSVFFPTYGPANGTRFWEIDLASPGDADGNRIVNFDDFLILSQNFGQSTTAGAREGDFDGDGRVGFADFLILSNYFSE